MSATSSLPEKSAFLNRIFWWILSIFAGVFIVSGAATLQIVLVLEAALSPKHYIIPIVIGSLSAYLIHWLFLITKRQLHAQQVEAIRLCQAEQALLKSEERFRAIFETAEDSIFIKDRDLKYVQVNPAMERLFERPAAELIGQTDADLFGEEAGAHVREVDTCVLKGETIEEEHTKPVDGVDRAFHTIKVPIQDTTGAITTLCGIARDITERKRAEQQLLHAHTRLAIAHEHLEELLEASVTVQASRTEQEALQHIASAVQKVGWAAVAAYSYCNWDRAHVAHVGLTDEEIEFLDVNQATPEERFLMFDVTREVFRVSRSYFIPSEQVDELMEQVPILPGSRELQPADSWQSDDLAYVPMYKSDGTVLGSITLDNPMDGQRPGIDQFRRLEFFADLAAQTIERIRLDADRNQMESDLRDGEQKLRSIVENSTNMFYSHTTDHVLTYVSPQVRTVLDCEPEEAMIRWTEFATDHPVNEIGFHNTQRAIETGERQGTFELELITRKGRVIIVKVREAPVVQSGKTIQIVGSLTDITERKKAEEAIRESEERFRSITDQSGEGITVADTDGNYTFVNPAFCKMTGYSEKELLQMTIFDMKGSTQDSTTFEQSKTNKEGVPIQVVLMRKDGTEFISEVTGKNIAIDGEDCVLGIVRDITERIKAEAALTEERARAQRYLDIAGVMIVATDNEGNVTLVNRKTCEILGYEEQEIIGSNWFDNYLPQSVRNSVKQVSQDILAGKIDNVEYYENPILTKYNGERCVAWHNIALYDDDGSLVGHLSSGQDITEQRLATEALHASEKQLSGILEHSPSVIFLKDIEGRYLRVNRRFEEVFCVTNDEIQDKTDYDIFPHKIADTLRNNDLRIISQGEASVIDESVPHDDGMHYYLSLKYPTYDREGSIIAVCGIATDVTEHKQVQDALRKSEEQYKNFFDNTLVGLFRSRLSDGLFLDVNPTAARQIGLPVNDIIGKLRSSDTYQNHNQREELLSILRKDGEVRSFEADLILPNDNKVTFSISVKAYPDKDYMEGAIIDITERKHAEKALQMSESNMRAFMENAKGFGVYRVEHDQADPHGAKITFASPSIKDILGIELIDNMISWFEDIHEDDMDRVAAAHYKSRTTGTSFDETFRIHHQDKHELRWIRALSSAVFSSDGTFDNFNGLIIDVTDIKRAEETLQNQTKTQKLLLRELDHRVRNNLSSLISLIDISKSGATTMDEFADAMRSRTRAIASVHSFLSLSHWRGGSLKSMLTLLVQSPRQTHIRIDGHDTVVPLSQAQALGLVINELTTNSIKHGAMSVAGASVTIKWTTEQLDDDKTHLKLHWCETGGPRLTKEIKFGVGSNLILGLCRSELQGKAELSYPPEGASHTLCITLSTSATAQFESPIATGT